MMSIRLKPQLFAKVKAATRCGAELGRFGEGVGAQLPTGSFRNVLEAAWSDTDFRAALQRTFGR